MKVLFAKSTFVFKQIIVFAALRGPSSASRFSQNALGAISGKIYLCNLIPVYSDLWLLLYDAPVRDYLKSLLFRKGR